MPSFIIFCAQKDVYTSEWLAEEAGTAERKTGENRRQSELAQLAAQ